MNIIVITLLVIGGIGLVCGILLALAANFLAIKEDPRVEKLLEILPNANCGSCSFAGCADYAKAIIVDGVAINMCTPGGPDIAKRLAAFMGVELQAMERKVAIILCGGDKEKAPRRSTYNGIADCTAANAVDGGDKICRYGCLGYGSCSRVCPVGAIEISNDLAVVHEDLCIGCGLCAKTCPRGLIKIIPAKRTIHVLCSSKDKGPVVKKACKVGCIGCSICSKLAPNEAIKMDGFLARVDYTKDLENIELVEKCPGKCIIKKHDLK